MVDGIWCMPAKLNSLQIKTVASMYISAADKQVSGKSADLNDDGQCICDKLYCGHARSGQVLHVINGIWCISPMLNSQIMKTVASMYISAADKQVSGNLAGLNDDCQCICDELFLGGHA